MDWNGWPLSRIIILAMGLLSFVVFIQVTMFHYRQNFHHWSMWIPVLATPVFGLFLVMYAFHSAGWLLLLNTVLLSVGVLAGLFGSFMHIRGVGQRVDGYKLRNFLVGPPLTLPSLITATCILGLFAMYWE